MCTLTWLHEPDGGYQLLFNRDELKTRQRAELPRVHCAANGVEYIAPIDTDAGGTWIAVNTFGVTICLLNDYRAPDPDIPAHLIRSRGEVVAKLGGCDSADTVRQALENLTLQNYRGLRLVVFADDLRMWRWDTKNLLEVDGKEIVNPITSSSYDEVNVQKTRAAFFNSLDGENTIEKLLHFHSAHIDDELCEISGEAVAVSSVCMHRTYSNTVSQCHVAVRHDAVSMAYTDGAPCQTRPGAPLVLPRIIVATAGSDYFPVSEAKLAVK